MTWQLKDSVTSLLAAPSTTWILQHAIYNLSTTAGATIWGTPKDTVTNLTINGKPPEVVWGTPKDTIIGLMISGKPSEVVVWGTPKYTVAGLTIIGKPLEIAVWGTPKHTVENLVVKGVAKEELKWIPWIAGAAAIGLVIYAIKKSQEE